MKKFCPFRAAIIPRTVIVNRNLRSNSFYKRFQVNPTPESGSTSDANLSHFFLKANLSQKTEIPVFRRIFNRFLHFKRLFLWFSRLPSTFPQVTTHVRRQNKKLAGLPLGGGPPKMEKNFKSSKMKNQRHHRAQHGRFALETALNSTKRSSFQYFIGGVVICIKQVGWLPQLEKVLPLPGRWNSPDCYSKSQFAFE